MTLDRIFRCSFCNKKFTRKSWYDKHMCDKKRRFNERHNIATIKAHQLFNHWQRKNGYLKRGKIKSMEDFCKSPYFNLFKRLSEYTMETYLISSYKYLDYLIVNGISERDWTSGKYLDSYLSYVSKNENALDQAKTTYENIKVWCKYHEVDTKNFFTTIKISEALKMIRDGKLMPWVLFAFEDSLEQLISRFEGEVLYTFDQYVNVDYWIKKIDRHPDDVDRVREFMRSKL